MADMADDASRLGQEATNVAGEAKQKMAGAAGRAREFLSDARDTAVDYGQQGYDMARERASEMKDKTQKYITENPWYAIGIAAGVGLLVGMLLHSNSRD